MDTPPTPLRWIVALAIALILGRAEAQSSDLLTWFDSQLPPDQFIGFNSQGRAADGTWRRARDSSGYLLPFQPFRSSVNREGRQIYWRKDEIDLRNSWYGEIFSFDDQHIALRTETFPQLPVDGGAWDQRPERFRSFRNVDKPGQGRILAPRQLSPGWNTAQAIETAMCGVSSVNTGYRKVDGWLQALAGNCAPFQQGGRDARVEAAVVRGWSIYEPGMDTDAAAVLPGPDAAVVRALPRVWDAALVISQFMPWVGGYARERFILGWHGGVYHGMIAWDESWGPDFSQQQVIRRAVPEALLRRVSGPMDFDGMLLRGQRDRTLPPPGIPRDMRAACIPGTASALVRWTGVPGQPSSDVRVNDRVDAWMPFSSPNDVVINAYPTANSFIVDTKPGRRYDFWAHARNESGESGASAVSFDACTGSGVGLPGMPRDLKLDVLGDIAVASWEPVPGATSYDVRVDDLSDSWQPGVSRNDIVANDHKAVSYVFKLVPGRKYNWWVHARNARGTSGAVGGATASYAAP